MINGTKNYNPFKRYEFILYFRRYIKTDWIDDHYPIFMPIYHYKLHYDSTIFSHICKPCMANRFTVNIGDIQLAYNQNIEI